MHLDMAGVNHQPLKVRVIGHFRQQFGPLAALLPAPEAVCGGVPVSVIRGQIALGRAGAEDPEHAVYEAAIVLGGSSHLAEATGEVWRDSLPGEVGDVLTAVGWRRCSGGHEQRS